LQKEEFLESNIFRSALTESFENQRRLYQKAISRSEADRNEYQLQYLLDQNKTPSWTGANFSTGMGGLSMRLVNCGLHQDAPRGIYQFWRDRSEQRKL
jgi:hypothetical protein